MYCLALLRKNLSLNAYGIVVFIFDTGECHKEIHDNSWRTTVITDE
jgi:hypothetical protein